VPPPPPPQVNEAAKACKLQPLPGDSKTLKAARQVFDKCAPALHYCDNLCLHTRFLFPR